jgi:protein TonB
MKPISAARRSGVSLFIALVIHVLLLLWLFTQWQWPQEAEPLKNITATMRLITSAPDAAQKVAALPDLALPAPAKKRAVKTHAAAPAAPRSSVSERDAHKAVSEQALPSVPASIGEQIIAPLPTAPQPPEETSRITNQASQEPTEVEAKQLPALSVSALKDIAAAYRTMVHGRIAALQTFPALARRLGEEGTVLVRFTILASGKIAQVSIVESSGSQSLDVAAVDIFTQGLQGYLPPIPAELNKQEWILSLPIRYQLR